MQNKTIQIADEDWLSRCEDFEQSVLRYKNVRFSRFVSPHDFYVFKTRFHASPFVKTMAFGGENGTERVMIGFFPSFSEPSEELFPIKKLLISGVLNMSHRDILGAVLGLGIKRELTGDIFINGDKAVLMCDESIAEFLLFNLVTVGRKKVKVSYIEDGESFDFCRDFEELKKVVSSLRLDALVAAACGVSRADAADLINKEYVSLNFFSATDTSKKVSEGDTISVRHHGRFILSEVCGETKKGRLAVVIKKFI